MGTTPKPHELEESIIRQVGTLFEQTLSKPPPSNIVELWKEHVEIRRVLTTASDLQSSLSDTNKRLATQTRSAKTIKSFLEWSDHIGIARNNVEIVESAVHGLELKANGTIPKGHIAVKVPRHAMFSLDLAKKSAMLKKAFERDPIISGMANVGLALFLAAQYVTKDSSKWSAYIDVLPNVFSTPIFYTEEQLLLLKPSPIFEEALQFYRTIARQFSYFLIAIAKNRVYENVQKNAKKGDRPFEPPVLYNAPFTVANFTPKLYWWSVGVVTTRVNMVPSETEKTDHGQVIMMPALIPVLDMSNHETVPEIPDADSAEDHVCFSSEHNCAMITCHSDVSAGDPITIFYGRRSNGEHLLHNGFVPNHQNTYDIFKLKIGIPKTDKDLETKKRLITQLVPTVWSNTNIFQFDIINHPRKPFHPDLVTFSAIFVTQNPTKDSIESIESKKKGLNFLKNRIILLEKSYGKTVDLKKLTDIGFDGDLTRLKSSELHILGLARLHCEELENKL